MRLPKIILFQATLAVVLLGGCEKKATPPAEPNVGKVSFAIEHMVGAEPLVLDTRTYQNALGQGFTVSLFSYYLSNIRLKRADGTEYVVPESYHLLREPIRFTNQDSGKNFTLENIPAGEYTGLTFMVGVDSVRNGSGAQTGALSPSNNMFWTWNTGYIFLKMEGYYQPGQGNSPRGLSYHFGNTPSQPPFQRWVSPPLPAGTKLTVAQGATSEVMLKTDLARLFYTPSDNASRVDFTTAATLSTEYQIARNYAGVNNARQPGTNSMFTVHHVVGR